MKLGFSKSERVLTKNSIDLLFSGAAYIYKFGESGDGTGFMLIAGSRHGSYMYLINEITGPEAYS